MVERLKSAIEKARAQREGFGATPAAQPAPSPAPTPASGPAEQAAKPSRAEPAASEAATTKSEVGLPAAIEQDSLADWSIFEELPLDEKQLRAERIISRHDTDPARKSFDMLRSRILRVFREKNWRRLGVISPTKGVGKTTVVLNLAFSLARQPDARVLLLDLDLAAPQMSHVLAPDNECNLPAFLSGDIPPEKYLRRCGSNLLVGLNKGHVPGSSEIVQSVGTARVLKETIERTKPTIVLFDISPVLASDDAINVLAYTDCALMIVGAGQTRASEIADAEKLVGEWTHLLGLVLNGSEEKTSTEYAY